MSVASDELRSVPMPVSLSAPEFAQSAQALPMSALGVAALSAAACSDWQYQLLLSRRIQCQVLLLQVQVLHLYLLANEQLLKSSGGHSCGSRHLGSLCWCSLLSMIAVPINR